jgi:hemoglobin
MERERTDLRNRDDVLTLVTTFYRRAFDDELLGPIFVDVARMDLAHHLPIICDFWETVLFQAGLSLNARAPLGAPHFERWLRLWTTTVDDAFAGEKAELAKTQAARIAGSIQRRLQGRSGSDFETLRTGPDAAGARQRAAGGTG